MAGRVGEISQTETDGNMLIKWEISNIRSAMDQHNQYRSPSFLCENEFCYIALDNFSGYWKFNDGYEGSHNLELRQYHSRYLRLRIFDVTGKEIVSYKSPEGGLFISRVGITSIKNYDFDVDFGGWLLLPYRNFTRIGIAPVTIFVDLRLNESNPHAQSNNSRYPSLCGAGKVPGKIFHVLSENLKNSYLNKLHTDMEINVQQNKFQVHKMVLAARSLVFAAMMQTDMKESKCNTVNVTDCEPGAFHVFLLFLYSGETEGISSDNVLDVFFVADKYGVDQLKSACVTFMKKNLSVDNFCDVLELAAKHNDFKLLKTCQQYFTSNSRKIFLTEKWQLLMKMNTILANELLLLLVPDTSLDDESKHNVA